MERKKPNLLRRVWRTTPQAPMGEFVEIDLDLSEPAPLESPSRASDPDAEPDWRSSSWDLLNGLEVRDHSDSIPGALFEKLFKR